MKTQLLLLALIVIPLTGSAYAETPSHVDVYTHPFTVSVMEGGSITIHNEDTSVYRFVAWGWFEPILLNPNESVASNITKRNELFQYQDAITVDPEVDTEGYLTIKLGN